MSKLKILFWDTEFTPMQGYFWSLYPERIPLQMVDTYQEMLCYGTKWKGKKTVVEDRRIGHRDMLENLRDRLTEADAVVSWNGMGYDTKMVQAEFVRWGISPAAPFKEIDLMRVVKKNFKFASYKLDYVAEQLLGEKKLPTDFQLWRDVMADDPEAWKRMRDYQKQDVELLEKLYHRLLPWIKMPHPVKDGDDRCRNCGGHKLIRRGYAITLNGRYPRVSCKDCGTWGRGGDRKSSTNIRNIT